MWLTSQAVAYAMVVIVGLPATHPTAAFVTFRSTTYQASLPHSRGEQAITLHKPSASSASRRQYVIARPGSSEPSSSLT
jgi:hypothetical protein